MVSCRSGSAGAVTVVESDPLLLVSLRSAIASPGSAVALTVTAPDTAGSCTDTAKVAPPPTGREPPEQVVDAPLPAQVQPLSAGVRRVAPAVAIRTATPRAAAALVPVGLATRTVYAATPPPTADAGPLTVAVRSGSFSTGSTPQIGGGSGTSQLGRADAGTVVTTSPTRTRARAATTASTRRTWDMALLTVAAHPAGGLTASERGQRSADTPRRRRINRTGTGSLADAQGHS